MFRKLPLYLAGGLFSAEERLHVLYLEKYLKLLGYKVIVPQREALRFQDRATHTFDIGGIVKNCREAAENSCYLFVGCVDGADADSGTCVEYGNAITATGRAIVYRTDFRTLPDREIGLNAMLHEQGTEYIYHPCFITEIGEVDGYYSVLACEIHAAVQKILEKEHSR